MQCLLQKTQFQKKVVSKKKSGVLNLSDTGGECIEFENNEKM